ncbi:N-acyl-D-amino-acid deacylase family protein [Acetohalobium arabaticum]|uniref:N-acyl-D-amino-acid deacylase n=1 Tax=Acetohalobium arabaticum (strain ATCC 49924 / DSM 5501 / Z-7288) TaxID=574087 RepID=D9QSU9_ACEAZ|nr:D-aminoacylase [Acetohalobium arabaticum]ADL11637.1 N-acyl-D-amino-acid deacylase [Acetohalobium arabaticum DSM 5501]
MKLDLKLSGGTVVDGTGRDRFRTDIGIKDGEIVKLGDLKELNACIEYNIEGLIIAPGFIDIHSHSKYSILANPKASGKVYQGVTTEVVGNCGSSAAPVTDRSTEAVQDSLDKYNLELEWQSFAGYFGVLEKKGTALNIASLVGHGLLRKSVMGDEPRRPTNDELIEMKQLLASALEDGAWGLSTGLIYPPSSYAATEELMELAQVAAEYNGIYSTHLRSEGDELIKAVKEAIKIGRETGVSVEISHHKAIGKNNWGKVDKTLELITKARDEGFNISCDMYPYLATSTGLAALLPAKIKEGGKEKVLRRLQNKKSVAEIKQYWQQKQQPKDYWSKILISEVSSDDNQHLEGKSITQIAERRNQKPADIVIKLLIEEELQISMVKFSISEADLKKVLEFPETMISSDSLTRVKDGLLDQGKPHPRAYGSFPRVIDKFVKDKELLTLEEAVKKMSYLPAQKLGLNNRGEIAVGKKADLAVFDLTEFTDQATYKQPHRYAAGLKYLIINGQPVVEDAEQTSALPGRVLINL